MLLRQKVRYGGILKLYSVFLYPRGTVWTAEMDGGKDSAGYRIQKYSFLEAYACWRRIIMYNYIIIYILYIYNIYIIFSFPRDVGAYYKTVFCISVSKRGSLNSRLLDVFTSKILQSYNLTILHRGMWTCKKGDWMLNNNIIL